MKTLLTHLKLFVVLTFIFIALPNTHAETLVEVDIAEDTTWTKEMSPIFIERRNDEESTTLVFPACPESLFK